MKPDEITAKEDDLIVVRYTRGNETRDIFEYTCPGWIESRSPTGLVLRIIQSEELPGTPKNFFKRFFEDIGDANRMFCEEPIHETIHIPYASIKELFFPNQEGETKR